MRHREDMILKQLAARLPGQLKNQKFSDPHVKVNLLIHAHLSRIQLSAELSKDTDMVVLKAIRLVQACVDVLSSNESYLKQFAATVTLVYWSERSKKVNLLIHAHLSRIQLSAELSKDTDMVVLKAIRLVQACVDVLSSNGWLSPAIHAMELSQMLTQAMYSNESYLKQLPHCNAGLLERAKQKKVESIFELLELEDDVRRDILRMEDVQLADVAKFCNNYPSIEVEHTLESDSVNVGDTLLVNVTMERENHINGLAPPVVAPLFPQKRKEEGWWLVVGDPAANALYSIKRCALMDFKLFYPGSTLLTISYNIVLLKIVVVHLQ
ncbi:Sec63 domain protein [Oesophagostomum dentatum]|uniref:Sec63 domain protein n=1 Tax=Oesophagostomum dentatum TaxID=61180 RepID=A0A0B1T673_OESDE|nr:Sec63 domain protein [Oesophagostomum dentatum]